MPAIVEAELCTACRSCEEVCPNQSVEVLDNLAVVKKDECIECAACVDACQTHAMSMAD
jgi:NAD-dependent dihydropyrimidine dehydrogenase PreA subunit